MKTAKHFASGFIVGVVLVGVHDCYGRREAAAREESQLREIANRQELIGALVEERDSAVEVAELADSLYRESQREAEAYRRRLAMMGERAAAEMGRLRSELQAVVPTEMRPLLDSLNAETDRRIALVAAERDSERQEKEDAQAVISTLWQALERDTDLIAEQQRQIEGWESLWQGHLDTHPSTAEKLLKDAVKIGVALLAIEYVYPKLRDAIGSK